MRKIRILNAILRDLEDDAEDGLDDCELWPESPSASIMPFEVV